MGRQIRPAKVYQMATAELQSRVSGRYQATAPPWYSVIYDVPPAETMVRPAAVQLSQFDTRQKKPKNVYRPQKIKHIEDGLRQNFYQDHPWELARPRMILESDGKDSHNLDWSKGVRQPGMALSGECVVQRQLWLMKNHQPSITREEAYDKARREFYALRQEEEIEVRIAKEEAQFVGAYFGKTRVEIGHQLEGKNFEQWKVWAMTEIERLRALRTDPSVAVAAAAEPPTAEGPAPIAEEA